MFRTSVAGLLVVAAAVVAASPPCPKGLSYWDTNRQECAQCKVCLHNEVVLIPCQPYTDTLCGPMSALKIKWPWRQPAAGGGHGRPSTSTTTPTPTSPTTTTTTTAAPTRLHVFSTRKMRPLSRRLTTATSTASTVAVLAFEEATEASTTVSESPPTPSTTEAASSTTEAVVVVVVASSPSTTEAPTTKVSAQPFLQTESALEWDWQTLVLAVIIAAFVVLLVIFAVYAAVHARRATHRRRRIQKELDAAQLSLFPVTSGHDAELQTLNSPSSPKGMFKANKCLYLEKLLEQKQTRRANIYVETGRQATPAPARRSSRWKEKPTAARTPC